MASFSALPDDVVEKTLGYLDARGLGACTAVNHASSRAAISEFELVAQNKWGGLRCVPARFSSRSLCSKA